MSKWTEYFEADAPTLFTESIRLQSTLNRIVRHAGGRGAKLLEAGCGTSLTSILLADLGYDVTAVDLDLDVCLQARERIRRRSYPVHLARMDIGCLGFRDGAFAVAFSQGVLEHFDDGTIVGTLREQARVARAVVFDVPNARSGERPFGDERLMTNRRWRALVARAGLRVMSVTGRGFPAYSYVLPRFLFAQRLDTVGRFFGQDSIFVCTR